MQLQPGPILVQLPNWLGDSVVSTGTLTTLATAMPGHPIDVLGNDIALAIVRGHPAVRRLLPLRAGRRPARRLRRALELRSTGYVASVTLPPSGSAAVLARVIGAPVRVGFGGPSHDWCFAPAVPRPVRGDAHLLDEFLALATTLVSTAQRAAPSVTVAPATRDQARERLGDGEYLVLAPGASYGPAKRWAAEGFARAARELVAGRSWRVVVVGGHADRDACAEVARFIDEPVLDLSGGTTIAELAAVLAGARVVIANDSGPMHLAAAVGAPVVGLFGSTDPRWTAPVGGAVVTAPAPPSCAPCFQRTCDIGYPCLRDIDASSVVQTARELLDGRAGHETEVS